MCLSCRVPVGPGRPGHPLHGVPRPIHEVSMFLRPLLGAAALALLASTASLVTCAVPAADSVPGNVVTPGSFHGYGFDQCMAPSQTSMDTWLRQSPYLAVGIYISGSSRACRVQPNLSRTWVST